MTPGKSLMHSFSSAARSANRNLLRHRPNGHLNRQCQPRRELGAQLEGRCGGGSTSTVEPTNENRLSLRAWHPNLIQANGQSPGPHGHRPKVHQPSQSPHQQPAHCRPPSVPVGSTATAQTTAPAPVVRNPDRPSRRCGRRRQPRYDASGVVVDDQHSSQRPGTSTSQSIEIPQ